MIDMHCHLDLYPDPYAVVERCKSDGCYVLSVTTTPKAWHGTSALADGCGRVHTALGLHPQLARDRWREIELFDELLPRVKYVGEIGLDGGRTFRSSFERQVAVFLHILRNLEKCGGRLMSLHSRCASGAVIDLLAEHPDAGLPVLHWFTGSKSDLRAANSIGCWFSVGPAMLATKRGRELVMGMPRGRVLTETDGPFARARGECLMPWDVESAVRKLSNLWGCDLTETRDILMDNLKQVLSIH